MDKCYNKKCGFWDEGMSDGCSDPCMVTILDCDILQLTEEPEDNRHKLYTAKEVAAHYGEFAMIHGHYRNYTKLKPFKINAQIIHAAERGYVIELCNEEG